MDKEVILFIGDNKTYFSSDINNFKQITIALGKLSPFKVNVIDVKKNPELAEKYKIDALPTLVIGNKKFIGKPNAKKIIDILNNEVV